MNLDKLRILAAGSYTVVFTDDTLVMKIGLIEEKQPKMIKYAHMHGFSVPMIAYERYVKIPQFIQDMIANDDYYQNGSIMTDPDRIITYVLNNCADVMIVGLAVPFLNPTKHYTASSIQRAYAIAEHVQMNYECLTRGYWMDAHPYNLAKYNGNLVIIDF